EEVREAGQEALGAIGEEVDAVRESLNRELPFEDVAANGIVTIRARIGPQAPPPAGGGDQNGAVLQEQTEGQEQGGQQPAQPSYAGERRGTGFAVAQEGEVVFIATSFSLIVDPDAAGGVSEAVEVGIRDTGFVPAAVHSWDANRDLALLRAELGEVTILDWRPADEELAVGARLVVAGVTPDLQGIQLAAELGFVDVDAIVTDLPAIGLLAGAPLVDDQGHVVAVYSTTYAPFGVPAGPGGSAVPARLLCERMLRNCDALEAYADGEGDQSGEGSGS
ncbi:MAG: serine protease, partial [Nitriliruptorales bacterium]|nr:serine protease [Nitriliruptorales bacterium]